jgi:hypothetical protein
VRMDFEDIVALMAARKARPKKRSPYKKKSN